MTPALIDLSGSNSTTSGVVTLEKENWPSTFETNRHSFRQEILQDVQDARSPSPNRLSQPLKICSTAANWISHPLLSCFLNVKPSSCDKNCSHPQSSHAQCAGAESFWKWTDIDVLPNALQALDEHRASHEV